jgi:hypothetical protein
MRTDFRRGRTLGWAATLVIASIVSAVSSARAQDTARARVDSAAADTVVNVTADRVPRERRSQRFRASPLLPPDHWAVRAAARLEGMGLAPGYLPAQRAVPRQTVALVLERAAERTARGRPDLAYLTEGWWTRFREEFREYGEDLPAPGLAPLGSFAGAGAQGWAGRLEPRVRDDPPAPIPDRTEGAARVQVAWAAGRHFAGASEETFGTDAGADVPRWELVAAAGNVALSVGDQPVAYGWGRAGGFVFADPDPLPRVELQTTAPTRLGGPLGFLGTMSFHAFASRLDEDRHAGDPWMWGARLALRPRERLTLGVTRGAIFGGDVAEVTPGRLLRSLAGVIDQSFDNQILSFDLRWRLPTERAAAATLYVEWASDDAGGGLNEQPAVLAGMYLPALPGMPNVALGLEHARIARCCGHGSWYFHTEFRGYWAREGRPLGHPLGGGGSETRLYADADLYDALLRVTADAFVRDRAQLAYDGSPGTLFAPDRTGTGGGASLGVEWRLSHRGELRLRGAHEGGDGWREQTFQAELRYLF